MTNDFNDYQMLLVAGKRYLGMTAAMTQVHKGVR